MDLGDRFPVHLPRKQHLVTSDFPIRNGDDIVVDFALLKIRVHAHKLDMFRSILQASAVFEDFLQANTSPFSSANRTFTPLCPVSIQVRNPICVPLPEH